MNSSPAKLIPAEFSLLEIGELLIFFVSLIIIFFSFSFLHNDMVIYAAFMLDGVVVGSSLPMKELEIFDLIMTSLKLSKRAHA